MTKLTKIYPVLILLISFTNFSCNQDQTDNQIFRNISIGKYGTLELGEQFKSKDKLAIKINGNIYQLRDHVFQGATSIIFHLNDNGMITMMRFEYDPGINYNDQVKMYTKILGPSSQTHQSGSLKKAIWDDSTTRFEYIKESGKNKSLVYSTLYDKKLWKK
ncbi:MAG: hypothetical protein ABII90_08140 [Bacteroidota bacterium]